MYLHPQTPAVAARQAIEKRILLTAVDELLAQGFLLQVDDGEETHPQTNNRKQLIDQLLETDEDYLYVFSADGNTSIGWLRFVYGNDGFDVLSDYVVNVEPFLAQDAGSNRKARQDCLMMA